MLAKLLEYVLYYYSGQEIYGLPGGLRERKFLKKRLAKLKKP